MVLGSVPQGFECCCCVYFFIFNKQEKYVYAFFFFCIAQNTLTQLIKAFF